MASTHSQTRTIERSLRQFRDEGELLGNLIYRGRNQYRGFGWWRKLVEVYKAQRRLSCLIGGDPAEHVHRELRKFKHVILKAYHAIRQIIQLESFMPLTMTCAAIFSRLYSCSDVLLVRLPSPKRARKDSDRKMKSRPISTATTPSAQATPSITPTSESAATSGATLPLHTSSTSSAGAPSNSPDANSSTKAPSSKPNKQKKLAKRDDIDDIFAGL